MKDGNLRIGSISLEPHEVATIEFLIAHHRQVELLKPSRQKGVKTADVVIDGLKWEMKSPKGNGKYTVQHAFKAAAKQAACIIFDIRRMPKTPEANNITKIRKEFAVSKAVTRVLIITKTGQIIDLSK